MKNFICVLILFCLFASCKKDIPENTQQITNMDELQINNNFCWQTGKNIMVNIHQTISGMLIISSEDESMQFYKGFYDGSQSDISIPVSIPAYIDKIKVNSQKVAVSGNTIDIYNLAKTKSTGFVNYSLHLNGTNDWMGVPNSGSMQFPNAFTLEAWVKAESNKSVKILQKGDWDGFSIGQDIWNGWRANVTMNTLQSEDIYWGSGQPVLNQWYYLSLTYDGSILKFYVDGVLKNSKTTTGVMNYTNRIISVGSDNGNQKFFKGNIDNVSIWNKALTISEVNQGKNMGRSGTETGLLAYWQCNEGSGNLVYNSTSNLLTGNLIGSFSLDTGYGSDNDGDGVLNGYDDYPNDLSRAFNNYFPSNGFGSLAFEDMWPGKGDYDFNDLVVDYHFCNVTNNNNKLVETYATFVVKATGASYQNGFGFQFAGNNIPQNAINITGNKLSENYISLELNGMESNQNKPTFIVFDNAFNCIPYAGGGMGVNTSANSPFVKPDTIILHITYTPGLYTLANLNISAFNPFMIINKIRSKEVHLVDYPPTILANAALFGTVDDAGNTSLNKFYRSKNNLPWAINIYEKFEYPFEKAGVLKAYLHLADWAQSNGVLYPDWYQSKTGYKNNIYIYHP